MASISVRYLVCQPGAAGALPRWFWQPSSKLRALGWRPRRVPLDWHRYSDAAQLQAAAIAAAQALNAELDAARATVPVPDMPAPAVGRTLGGLIAAYQSSEKFGQLAPATQRGYRQCLARLETWGADAPIGAVDAGRIRRLHASLSATPAVANAVVRTAQAMFAWGWRHDWVQGENPASRQQLASPLARGLIWPPEAVSLFAATAEAEGYPGLADAVRLNEWLGQREGDILRMGRSVYRNGALVVRPRKTLRRTGATATLPVDLVPHLKATMERILARHAARERDPGAIPATTLIISEATGTAYKPDNFRHVFARIRSRMAASHPFFIIDTLLPGRDANHPDAWRVRTQDLTFMHLRHTAVTRLAEAGCEPALIASITTHSETSVTQILARYTLKTAKMARLAFGKRMAAEGHGTRGERLGDRKRDEHLKNTTV